MTHRRWFTTERLAEAQAFAREVGGVLSPHLTIPERPPEHRHEARYVDWTTPGECPPCEWKPPHSAASTV